MSRRPVLFALAAAAPLAWWGWRDAVPPTEVAAQPARTPVVAVRAFPPELQPQRRALPAARSDLFAAPPRPPARPVQQAEIVEPPKAPPLPFRYGGSGEVQGQSFVFLARDGKSLMVSAGDTVDGVYRVEAVGRDRVVLRYLPLGIRQVMTYAEGEALPQVAAARAPGQPLALKVALPGEVVVGQEFVVTLVLPDAALNTTLEIGYDPDVLSALGTTLRRPGRAVVELASGGAARTQVRFKVLADAPGPGFTEIDLHASATDPSGRPVSLSTPPTQTVSFVLPGDG